ncbi:glycosyltransferase family 9 protein [Rhodopila sp.]|uniref:tetratricopeptide repeat-containing glycosyltransferase family protein n=1 Tax=Rhodopila sp. TaxID=2480087 RepID=UPI003D0EB6FA
MFAPPTEAERLVGEGLAALAARQTQAAEAAFGAALNVEPDHPMALTKLAEIALRRKDHALATHRLNAALAIQPHFAPAWCELSQACWMAGRRQDALAAARRAVDIQPFNPKHRLQLAQFAAWMGRGDETRRSLAPLLDPIACDRMIHATALGMLGELAVAEGHFRQADLHLKQALRLLPALPAPRLVLGMNQLRLGDFANGWANYAVREQVTPLYPDGPPPALGAVWQGQDLAGKTILVADDQGHGDSIQFSRYLPLLKARRAWHITLRTFPPLVRLLADAAPDVAVLPTLPNEARFDYHCTSSSLPRWFGTTLKTIPATMPCPRPPDGSRRPRRKRWQIGLAWSGDERHMRDHLRSIPAEVFLKLADQQDARFHSLQKDIRPSDLAALQARPAISRTVEKAGDFADTAALIAGLDLVITVDTAIAHLAGTLGKPVWILLHVAPDWRWLASRSDSPWYPSARLFRLPPKRPLTAAPRRDDPANVGPADVGVSDHDEGQCAVWAPLLRRVAAALRTFTAG